MLRKIVRRFRNAKRYNSSESYINYLRSKGVKIGENTYFFSPETTSIDPRKSFLIEIGSYCKITSGVTILAHDYSRSVVRKRDGINIGGSAPTVIGDNCFIGIKATILMGSKIGNNCIIGACSLVHGEFPDDCVIAGNPARVICSIEEYKEKRLKRIEKEAVDCVRQTLKNTGKLPTIKQMGDGFAWMYLPRNEDSIKCYPEFFALAGDDQKLVISDFLKSKPRFDSYETFIKYAQDVIANHG